MIEKKTIDILDLEGCQIKDEDGTILAILSEAGETIVVKKTTACSLGSYLYIITYLRELGFDVR